MIAIASAAAFFGCIAFFGVQTSAIVCANVTPAADGPPPGRAPVVVLIAAAALLGGALMALKVPALEIGIAAIAVFALVASWCSDAACGIVPDLFTLVPLAVLLFFAVAHHDWVTIMSAGIAFTPFAIAAIASRGHGMGWGDAKLVALSGALLGPIALMALAPACLAAAVVNRLGRARGSPIAFAPYIAAATGIVLPLGLVH